MNNVNMAPLKNKGPAPCPDRSFFERAFYDTEDRLLRIMGMRPWNKPSPDEFNGKTLWLLPASWYPDLPNGFKFVHIDEQSEPFSKGKTSDDQRFGVLSFGLVR